jgi:outer membrane murein-binding lipoprotein Lpp
MLPGDSLSVEERSMPMALFRKLVLAVALGTLFGTAQAQSNEQLKQMLDQALKTIDDLKGRVQQLESDRDKPKAATPAAPAAGQWGAPVVSPATRPVDAKTPDADQARVEVYGQVMLDTIYDFKRMNPDWQATLRPSQIPVACPGDPGCGADGAWLFSVRQSSLGLRSFIPTSWGLLKTDLSFDLFGSDGSTSIHWLSIWAELGMFGAGQTYSNFMDIDVFPNTIDYWGPSGMVFVRNPQLRITPWAKDGMGIAFALEAPNSALDTGKLTEIAPEFGAGFTGWNRLPDLTASWRLDRDWGHLKAAGILRQVGYQNTLTPNGDPKGTKTGYGLNLTGALKVFGRDQLSAGFVWGKAIASYMNDGGVDLAPGPGLRAETVQSIGWLAYYNHVWADDWSSTIGFSQHLQDNTVGQTATAFKRGNYGNLNLLYTPWKNVLTGLEFVWGELEQYGGDSATDYRLQFSTKLTF